MKVDSIRRYMTLHATLVKEKASLEERLARIDRALAGNMRQPARGAAGVPAARPGSGRRRRARNPMSLREAVLQAISARPLTKRDIMAAVTRSGYKFRARDPMNSLNALLYAKGRFRRINGKFASVK